jgi:DNA-3-methyladenine glycosylase II
MIRTADRFDLSPPAATPDQAPVRPTLRCEIVPTGPFSLAASAGLVDALLSFGPAQQDDTALRLAFSLEGSWQAVAVSITQRGRRIVVEASTGHPEQVASQVARLLSLDVDGTGFEALGERDAVVGQLQSLYPGLRPVHFPSCYEAAVWTVLSRVGDGRQAHRLRQELADAHGTIVQLDGRFALAFVAPQAMRALPPFANIPFDVMRSLRAMGAAAARGELDSRLLRGLPLEEALAHLTRLPGIDRVAAETILRQGVGLPDLLPAGDPRLARAVRLAYGPEHDVARVAQGWRPYRGWVALLLGRWLEDRRPAPLMSLS